MVEKIFNNSFAGNIYARLIFILLFTIGITFSSCDKDTPPPEQQTNQPTTGELPSGIGDGVTFKNGGKTAIFNLYAPGKKSVYLIGDFNNWQVNDRFKMKNTPNGNRWWIRIDDLDPDKAYGYQYFIDHTIKVADPYTHKILDPNNDQYIPDGVYPNLKPYPTGETTGYVSVMQANISKYSWNVKNFTPPDPKKLVVYELLLRDFLEAHSFKTLIDTLDYLDRLGINAIELMPVNEFEGNSSWGYNPDFLLALDKYYGTPNDYKAFVDACHQRGIAVIQDIVLHDQFGSSPMIKMYATSSGTPAADNPWFYQRNRHPYAVGYQLNQTSEATNQYIKDVLKYWIKEFHIDGFRIDQAKAFTPKKSTTDAEWSSYDPKRVDILTDYYQYIKMLDPDFYVILEFFAGNKEKQAVINQGMMVWNNLNYAACQAAMGYKEGWSLAGLLYDQFGISSSSKGGLVTYFESHDQERMQFKNETYGNSSGSYNVKKLNIGLKRDAMAAAFLFSSPGPKMIWQFQERGYDVSINQNGRLGEKDPHWEYMSNPDRKELYLTFSKLIHMKTQNAIFSTADFSYSLYGPVKWIQLQGENGVSVEVIGNFDVISHTTDIYFPEKGKWVDNLSNTSIQVSTMPLQITLKPGEYHLFSNKPLIY